MQLEKCYCSEDSDAQLQIKHILVEKQYTEENWKITL